MAGHAGLPAGAGPPDGRRPGGLAAGLARVARVGQADGPPHPLEAAWDLLGRAAARSPIPAILNDVEHSDHVLLIRHGVEGDGRSWADFGSGTGAFTLALADVLGPAASIVSVDRDASALRQQTRLLAERFPAVPVTPIEADFTRPLDLPPLDGIVMANALHFQRDWLRTLALVRGYLRPGGRLVLVEYDTDHGNPWVPHPLSFATWRTVADEAGFDGTRLLARVPSRFLGAIYSAVSIR